MKAIRHSKAWKAKREYQFNFFYVSFNPEYGMMTMHGSRDTARFAGSFPYVLKVDRQSNEIPEVWKRGPSGTQLRKVDLKTKNSIILKYRKAMKAMKALERILQNDNISSRK
jgi:hypothetical protein